MKITNADQLSSLLQDIRLAKGIPQNEIANEIELRQATISIFEDTPQTTKLISFTK